MGIPEYLAQNCATNCNYTTQEIPCKPINQMAVINLYLRKDVDAQLGKKKVARQASLSKM